MGAAAEGAGVVSTAEDELEAAYVRAIWERNAAVHTVETKAYEAYRARMVEHDLHEKLSAQRAFTAGAFIAAAIVAVALLFAALVGGVS